MKLNRPYVLGLTGGIACGKSYVARLLRQRRLPTEEERAALEAAFSRDGFTDGYWQGKTGEAMFGTRPEHAPERRAAAP